MRETIGQYRILRELGRGAMGVVYLAHDQQIDRHVAIKTFLLQSEENTQLRDALLREARTAGKLSHPNIITIYQIAEDGDTLYLVMEYVVGGSLDTRLSPGRPCEINWALALLRQVASALDAAHAARLVHRDIKPSNILLTESGDNAKVADFGLARTFVSGHSQTHIAGTPSYMSPEQLNGRQLDGRSDQFALGVLAYRLLSGQLPFLADNLVALAYQIATQDPTPVHMINRSLPAAVSDAVARALEKQRESRFPTCGAFIDAIASASQQTVSINTPQISWLDKFLYQATAGLQPWLALTLAVILGLAAFLYWRGTQIPKPQTPVATRQTPVDTPPEPVKPIPEAPPPQTVPKATPTPREPEVVQPQANNYDTQESQQATQNLVSAVSRKEPNAVINALLERHADPSAGLYAAAENCNEDAVKLLLAKGANPNWLHPSIAATALSAAIPRDRSDKCPTRESTIDLLLARGARPDLAKPEDGPVARAAALGPAGLPLLQKLLAAGSNPDPGLAPAAKAFYGFDRDCDTSVVDALLARGARPDGGVPTGKATPLMEASTNLCAAMVSRLLDRGASVNRTDQYGRTALYFALTNLNGTGTRTPEPVLNLLIKAGANPNLAADRFVGGETPMLLACARATHAIGLFLKAGGDPELKANGGNTCLHLAVASQSPRWAVAQLLAHKVKVNERDGSGHTALGIARSRGLKDAHPVVKLLLEANAVE